ncbi:MAG TPA: hypothetical protein VGL27_03500 [Negativicutes bacterium]
MKRKIGLIFVLLTLFCFQSYTFASYSPRVEGQPNAWKPGNSTGYFMWQDKEGLHLRTTTAGTEHIFSGTIRTNGRFEDVFGKMSGSDDYSRVNGDRDKITFQFTNVGGEAGIDFAVKDGKYIKFDLSMDGDKSDPANIFIGSDEWHPGSCQFTIRQDGEQEKDSSDRTIIIVDDDFWWGWNFPNHDGGHGADPGRSRHGRHW